MIVIVDYGAGNLRSVENAVRFLGHRPVITNDPKLVERADRVILPGVGHFGQMMQALNDLGLTESLYEAASDGRPFLGICLGMHALFDASEEAIEGPAGLGVIEGEVKRFRVGLAVPHMGWNEVDSGCPLIPNGWYTFAHSYYVPSGLEAVASCRYETAFAAAVRSGNAVGVQFHPEKSGALGLELLNRFSGGTP